MWMDDNMIHHDWFLQLFNDMIVMYITRQVVWIIYLIVQIYFNKNRRIDKSNDRLIEIRHIDVFFLNIT